MSEVELTISGKAKEAGPVQLVVTLALAGAISGLLLAFAYQVTKPIIDANNARELEAAIFEVVPGTEAIQRFAWRDDRLIHIARDEVTGDPVVFGAYKKDGTFLGYAIPGAGSGFQDTIRLLYGYDPQSKQVLGMWVLESRETPGLGDRIWKDGSFGESFRGLSVEPRIEAVKDNADAPNEIDAITGATISSKSVVKIINEENAFWIERLPQPGDEPRLEAAPESSDSGPGERTTSRASSEGRTDKEDRP